MKTEKEYLDLQKRCDCFQEKVHKERMENYNQMVIINKKLDVVLKELKAKEKEDER